MNTQEEQRTEAVGLRRLSLIIRTTDPEPVEFGNLFFLLILVLTYFPKARAVLYDPLNYEPAALIATVTGMIVLPLAFYAIVWQPDSWLRRVTLMAKVAIWLFVGVGIAGQVGVFNIRTAFCVALTASSLWAAWRVSQRPA